MCTLFLDFSLLSFLLHLLISRLVATTGLLRTYIAISVVVVARGLHLVRVRSFISISKKGHRKSGAKRMEGVRGQRVAAGRGTRGKARGGGRAGDGAAKGSNNNAQTKSF